ncbi:ATP-binding cassette domain-containing protein, partial [Rhizobium ruizarguesonis]
LEVYPLAHVHALSVGERQRVEIIRSLMTNPKLLILDEPTSVLPPQLVEKLFDTLRRLRDEGEEQRKDSAAEPGCDETQEMSAALVDDNEGEHGTE